MNNCNTHIDQYLKKQKNMTMKFGQLIECKSRQFFLKNHTQNVVEKLFPDRLLKNQN